jgi:nucleoside transporter
MYLTGNLSLRGGTDLTGEQAGWVMNAFALSSIVAMFVGGQLADRWFATERFLAFSHLIGGLMMLLMPMQKTFWPIFAVMLLHCLFYVPTLSLTNSICFANLKDSQKEFGLVRVWGTIGWIAASWPFVFLLIDWQQVPALSDAGSVSAWLGKALGTNKSGAAMAGALTSIFTVSGIASLVLAAFCLTLPHTPPVKDQGQKFAPFEAIKLLAVPAVLVLFVVTFLDTVVLWCYFIHTNSFLTTIGVPANWIMPVMSIGQIAEILTMAALGWALKSLGWRWTMTLGILGQVARFGIYALCGQDAAWLVVASNLIHGICYAFFFASVYVFVDEYFPKDARASAQGLFNLVIMGLGPLVANPLWGKLGDVFQVTDKAASVAVRAGNFNKLFLVTTSLALVATVALALFFHPPAKTPPEGQAGGEA